MSKDPGHVERAILHRIFDQQRRRQRVAVDVLQIVIDAYGWHGWVDDKIPRAQQVAALRAMHAIVRKYPQQLALSGGKGTTPLVIVAKRSHH